MLKFSNVLAFVVVVISAFIVLASTIFADAHSIPKYHKLSPSYTYRQYLADAGKTAPVDPLEYSRRERVFMDELKEVMTHNSKPGILYRKGINHMSDWTRDEKKRLNGGKAIEMQHVKEQLQKKPYHSFHQVKGAESQIFPRTWDWRTVENGRYVTAVKDQGFCGSCYAHGSTESLESLYAIATGKLFVLAQQEIVSCAPNPNDCGGTGGCLGSIAQLAFQHAIEKGMTQEWMYPYTSYYGETGKCDRNPKAATVAKFSGFKTVASNDQAAVMDALVSAGPLAVNVDASEWHNYESGIFNGCSTKKNQTIDHVVNLQGWGHDDGLNADYFIIKNSWSASFGEQGFIRLLKQDTPACGWNYPAQDGTACKGQNSTQWVCGECGVLFDTSYPIPQV